MVVRGVGGNAAGASAGRYRTAINLDHLDAVGEQASRAGAPLVGCFHTHVDDEGGYADPSNADLRAWLNECDRLGGDAYIGLIVSPKTPQHHLPDARNAGHWKEPMLTAFALRRDAHGKADIASDLPVVIDPIWKLVDAVPVHVPLDW